MRAALAQLLQLSVSRAPIRELMHAALRILHVGLGHQRVLLFLRDALTQVYRIRAARGLDADALFSPVGAITLNIEPGSARGQKQCLFTASLRRDAPLTIADATSARSQAVLPDWFKSRLPQVGSFLFLPITVNGNCFGGIYADRPAVDSLTSATDLTSIVMLRNQLVLALQAQSRPVSKTSA
jgi:GAF domain-containing protein